MLDTEAPHICWNLHKLDKTIQGITECLKSGELIMSKDHESEKIIFDDTEIVIKE